MPQRAVYKTTNAEYLDGAGSDPATFAAALLGLENSGSLVATAEELEGEGPENLPPKSADAFRLFIEAKGPGTFEQVVRRGYKEALLLASEKEQPIETFWVTAAGDDFELHICEGRSSIVVFMFIPGEEARPYGSRRAQSRSWVVRADRPEVHPTLPRTTLEDPIVKIQLSGPGESLP